MQNAGVLVKPRSAPLLKEYRLSVWAALKAGGGFLELMREQGDLWPLRPAGGCQ